MNALDFFTLISGLGGIAGLIFVFRYIYHSKNQQYRKPVKRPVRQYAIVNTSTGHHSRKQTKKYHKR